MKRIVIPSILALTLFLAGDLFACRCDAEGTVSVGIKQADVVFSGKVVSKTISNDFENLGIVATGDTTNMPFNWREIQVAVVKVRVNSVFKGELVSDILTILTPARGASCGYQFEVGENCIIYGTIYDEVLMNGRLKLRSFDNKTFWTHQCTRTQNWNLNEENAIIDELKK